MKKNKGSATIEMTLLIGMIIGMMYLFIMYLLFSIGLSKNMYKETESLYHQENNYRREVVLPDNRLRYNIFHVEDYQITIEMKRDKENPVAFIRRWQLVSRTVS